MPKNIDHFVIDSKLGEGSFGEVYRAYEPDINRVVALKLLSKDSVSRLDQERFLQEIYIVRSLDHPSIGICLAKHTRRRGIFGATIH